MTSGKLYAVYLSNIGPFALIQIEMSSFSNTTLAVDDDSHNFKELSGSQHLYTEYNHLVYVAIGEDVVELILNGETPHFNRILVGHPPTEIYVNTSGSRTYLKVHYEENSHSFVSTYRMGKYSNNTRAWKMIRREKINEIQQHDVTSRSEIISGAFVTVSTSLHYFCYAEQLQSVISCINVELAVLSNIINGTWREPEILPGSSSLTCSSDANCPILCSYQRFLVAKAEICEEERCTNTTFLFDLSTLENPTHIAEDELFSLSRDRSTKDCT